MLLGTFTLSVFSFLDGFTLTFKCSAVGFRLSFFSTFGWICTVRFSALGWIYTKSFGTFGLIYIKLFVLLLDSDYVLLLLLDRFTLGVFSHFGWICILIELPAYVI